MTPDWWDFLFILLSIGLLISFNAILVACEFSLLRVRFSFVNPTLLENAREHPGVSRMLDNIDKISRSIRFGTTLCPIVLGLLLIPLLLILGGLVGWDQPQSLRWWIQAGAVLVALAVYYFAGELIPRGIALRHPLGTLYKTALPVRIFSWLATPLLTPLNSALSSLFRTFRFDPSNDLEYLDLEAQIRSLGSDVPGLSKISQEVLKNTLRLRNRVIEDVMLSRNRINYLDLDNEIEENLQIARDSQHTRFPLCEGDLDHCIGLIHIKDLFRETHRTGKVDLRELARDILDLPMGTSAEEALQRMLLQRCHMALVKEEFGGTAGIVTLEQLLEELVGDIQDEFDVEEVLIQPDPKQEGLYKVAGLTPIHDLEEEIGINFGPVDVSTLGGLITLEAGRIPDKGEALRVGPLDVTITEVDARRVISAMVQLAPTIDEEED